MTAIAAITRYESAMRLTFLTSIVYLPLLLLHGSLALRLAGPLAAGAVGHLLALAAFALTVAGAARVWRARHSTSSRPRHESLAEH